MNGLKSRLANLEKLATKHQMTTVLYHSNIACEMFRLLLKEYEREVLRYCMEHITIHEE